MFTINDVINQLPDELKGIVYSGYCLFFIDNCSPFYLVHNGQDEMIICCYHFGYMSPISNWFAKEDPLYEELPNIVEQMNDIMNTLKVMGM